MMPVMLNGRLTSFGGTLIPVSHRLSMPNVMPPLWGQAHASLPDHFAIFNGKLLCHRLY